MQSALFGLLIGGLYGLGAVGLSLVFGVLRMLNVSHGELIMLGGYVSFWAFTLWKVDPFVSILISGPTLFLVGVILYQLLFRHLVHFSEEQRIKNSILVGFGLALILQTLAIAAWSGDERAISGPYTGSVLPIGSLVIPVARLGALAVAFLVLGGLHLFLHRTYPGKAIRATAEDGEGAALVGIPIGKIFLLALGLGSALAGVGGTLVSVADSISPAIGLSWTLKALIVVVLGGMGNILGTFAAGLGLGIVESVSGFFLGNAYREVMGLILLFLVLSLRPQGLFVRR